jgi:hypothetical protein
MFDLTLTNFVRRLGRSFYLSIFDTGLVPNARAKPEFSDSVKFANLERFFCRRAEQTDPRVA